MVFRLTEAVPLPTDSQSHVLYYLEGDSPRVKFLGRGQRRLSGVQERRQELRLSRTPGPSFTQTPSWQLHIQGEPCPALRSRRRRTLRAGTNMTSEECGPGMFRLWNLRSKSFTANPVIIPEINPRHNHKIKQMANYMKIQLISSLGASFSLFIQLNFVS